MNYKDQIDPELRSIARKIPYNKAVIRFANLYLGPAFGLTPVPRELTRERLVIKGHRGLPFRTEVFVPKAAGPLPCLLYIHGGAFSYKASVHHKRLACRYALEAGCAVYFPDYHRTPKYPYPAAYEDVLALYRYLLAHSAGLKIDPERLAVGGDSAGGALAALLCHRCQGEGLPPPLAQLLVYPVTDFTMGTASMKRFSDTPLWNNKNNRRALAYYLREGTDREAREASPLHCPLPGRIPPAYIETAEYDCLRDEGVLYGKRLREAGARVTLYQTKATFHGYDSALSAQISRRSVEKRVDFLRDAFGGGEPV